MKKFFSYLHVGYRGISSVPYGRPIVGLLLLCLVLGIIWLVQLIVKFMLYIVFAAAALWLISRLWSRRPTIGQ